MLIDYFSVRSVVGPSEPQAEDQVPGPDQGGERQVQGAHLENRTGKLETEESCQKIWDGNVGSQVKSFTNI